MVNTRSWTVFGPSAPLRIHNRIEQGDKAMLSTVLIVILLLALIGALPAWPYSGGWGYYPSGGGWNIPPGVLLLLPRGRVLPAGGGGAGPPGPAAPGGWEDTPHGPGGGRGGRTPPPRL